MAEHRCVSVISTEVPLFICCLRASVFESGGGEVAEGILNPDDVQDIRQVPLAVANERAERRGRTSSANSKGRGRGGRSVASSNARPTPHNPLNRARLTQWDGGAEVDIQEIRNLTPTTVGCPKLTPGHGMMSRRSGRQQWWW
eukprot:1092278-Amphidinium_carterae.1